MTDAPADQVERLLAAAEDQLRRLGLTERTIKARRKVNRATIRVHLIESRKDD